MKKLKKGIWDSDLEKYPENEYFFMYKDYECEIKRNIMTYTYCGYVQLPVDHPDYNESYLELSDVKVHGGLTFGNDGKFGFDCIHYNDISPIFSSVKPYDSDQNGHYWTFEETKEEVEKLVDQFIERHNSRRRYSYICQIF
jgi:hypothetical protein